MSVVKSEICHHPELGLGLIEGDIPTVRMCGACQILDSAMMNLVEVPFSVKGFVYWI